MRVKLFFKMTASAEFEIESPAEVDVVKGYVMYQLEREQGLVAEELVRVCYHDQVVQLEPVNVYIDREQFDNETSISMVGWPVPLEDDEYPTQADTYTEYPTLAEDDE